MTSSPIEIRVGDADDWEIWRAVRLRALSESASAFSSVLADWQGVGDTEARWRARLTDVEHNVIAFVDELSVGQASGDRHDGRVELISMFVASEARRLGVGRALIDAVVEWATRLGHESVELSVRRDNSAAIAAYERCGFVATENREDTPIDERLMRRAL